MSDKVVKVTPGRAMYYRSSIRGVTEQRTGKDTVYYGKVFRVARGDIAGAGHKTLEEAMLKEIGANAWVPPGGVFPDGGTMERYEILEPGTGDLLIMYRVPVQVAEDVEVPLPTKAGGVQVKVMDEEAMAASPPPDEFFRLYAYYLALIDGGRPGEAQEFAKELAELAGVVAARHGLRAVAASGDVPGPGPGPALH